MSGQPVGDLPGKPYLYISIRIIHIYYIYIYYIHLPVYLYKRYEWPTCRGFTRQAIVCVYIHIHIYTMKSLFSSFYLRKFLSSPTGIEPVSRLPVRLFYH